MFFCDVRAPSRRACSCATRSCAAPRRASDCARSSCGIVAVGGRHDPLVRQRADALPVVFRATHLALHFRDRGFGFVERRLRLGQLVPDLLGLDLECGSFLGQGALARGELRLRAGDLILRLLAVELELFAGRLQLEGDHVDPRLRLVEAQLVIRAVQLQQHVILLHHAAFVNVQRAHRAADFGRHRHHQSLDPRVVGHHVLGGVDPVVDAVIQADDDAEAQYDGGQDDA